MLSRQARLGPLPHSTLLSRPFINLADVEQAFFQRWWSEQTPDRQALTKTLVANGQLEFIK